MSKHFKLFFTTLVAFLLVNAFSCNQAVKPTSKNVNNTVWNLDDFVVEGKVIYGFSEAGAEKLKNNSIVELPCYNSKGEQIERIASHAFNPSKHEEIESWGDDKDIDGYDVKDIGCEFSYPFTGVVIPSGYKIVGQDAFTWNRKLQDVKIADTVELISEYAFAHTKINNLTLPESLKIINDTAFFDANIEGTLTLPKNLQKIGERSFKGNHITDIVFLCENLKSIPEEAFTDNQLKTITISASINEIHEDAFLANYGAREYGYYVVINTPNKDKNKSLKDGNSFYVDPDDTKKVKLDDIDFKKWIAEDFTYDGQTVTGLSKTGRVKIRENKDLFISTKTTDGKDVLKIGKDAFRNIDFEKSTYKKFDIETVNIPKTVIEIEDYAFQSNNIKEIIFGSEADTDKLALEIIGQGAFMNNKISNLDFMMEADNLKLIDNAAFHINEIEMLFIPVKVQKIGFSAFRENQINTLLFMPDVDEINNVSEIGEMAFLNNKLSELELPKKLKVVEVQAFAINNLESINLPEGLEEISFGAFAVNKLKAVELPNTVTKIAFNAFAANPTVETPNPVNITTKNKNKHNLPDGENYTIDKDDLAGDTEKSQLKAIITKIDELDKKDLRESTQKQYADMKKTAEALLQDNNASKSKVFQFVNDSEWFMTRIDLDKKINLAEKALKNPNNSDAVKLLQTKYEYALISYNNIAVIGEKVKRLEKELANLTDLVNNTGDISQTKMVQGHYELKSPLPIPPYHIGVNVYFKNDGTIYYVLDMSYTLGEGQKDEYGQPIENVDEDNEGYHVFALETLDKYEGIKADTLLNKSFKDFANEKSIELNDKNRYHIEGMFNAILDACKDYKKS